MRPANSLYFARRLILCRDVDSKIDRPSALASVLTRAIKVSKQKVVWVVVGRMRLHSLDPLCLLFEAILKIAITLSNAATNHIVWLDLSVSDWLAELFSG